MRLHLNVFYSIAAAFQKYDTLPINILVSHFKHRHVSCFLKYLLIIKHGNNFFMK